MSSKTYQEAYVWIWLPGETQPVVAGRLEARGPTLVFNYGKSYLAHAHGISIYEPELPLRSGWIEPPKGMTCAGAVRDGAPDAWGRRVLINRKYGAHFKESAGPQIDELTYLLESGSDRIGALDFQRSPTSYEPRESQKTSLDELREASALIEKGVPLTPTLAAALQHGTAIGGARPKALIESDEIKYIAKFSSSTDLYPVVKAEFIAMKLAEKAKLNVAKVRLAVSSGKDVLLIERFDRIHSAKGWQRRSLISALTLFQLDEMMARYSSYEELAQIVRHSFTDASQTLRELFSRLIFNILSGNTDDHARNHAAFWDGRQLTLTPAYDICPQGRTGNEASQAMKILGSESLSALDVCLRAAPKFHLTTEQGLTIIEKQIEAIIKNWIDVCDEAGLDETSRAVLKDRQFLNPFAFENLKLKKSRVTQLVAEFKAL